MALKWMGNSEKFEYIKGWFRIQNLGWTNCVCDLCQPLREFKLLKFGFRSKTLCLLSRKRSIWRLSRWTFNVFVPYSQWSRLFNWVSPVQGIKPVKVGGLSGENSVAIGNKNEEYSSSPVYQFGLSGLTPVNLDDKNWLVRVNLCQFITHFTWR